MSTKSRFNKAMLKLDCAKETEKIAAGLFDTVIRKFRRKGIVVAISGGIDSSVVAGLAAKAFGPERVYGLLMPEKDSSPETLRLSRMIPETLKIPYEVFNITSVLEAVGCYQRRNDAIRTVIPEFRDDYTCKIILPGLADTEQMRIYSVMVESPTGDRKKARLTAEAYCAIVAATNFKQRIRKMMEYYHADRLNYAVSGTPNRQEYDQGFFVKLGDGAADIKPIAHLYKTQVYQMAEYLGIPEEIRRRPPTTDTYSMPQGQDEFYFSVSYEIIDACLYGKNHGFTPEDVASEVGLTVAQVQRVYSDIDQKRRTTAYLHASPRLIEPVQEIQNPQK